MSANKNERYEKWYAEAKKQTLETLPAFMKKILDEPQDYNSIVEAVAACAVGAAWAADHHKNGGITGFQGSCVMWRFVQYWMSLQDSCGLRIINYDDMLYPQCEYKFTEKTINKETWDAMQKKAAEFWNECGGSHAADRVLDHWRSIIEGNVPFGYKVED